MSQSSSRSIAVDAPSRRAFLQASVAAGGALLLGFRVPWVNAASPGASATFAELARRGWSDSDLKKLAGENLLRVFGQAEAVAKRLQASSAR